MSVVIDTSVWSLALRRKREHLSLTERSLVNELAELIKEGRIRMLGVVRQELLSGVKTPEQFEKLRIGLHNYPDVAISTADHEHAAKISNSCKARGITMVSIVDALICSVALDRNFSIFTTDPDFLHFTNVIPIRLYLPRISSPKKPN